MGTLDNKLVSCIIPSYKRAETLRRAINSALAQTYKDIEVLVVDDNIAGDEYSLALQQIIDEYKDDNRVILISQPKHINGAEARNAGVRAAKGYYIAFLDDDDEWLSDKIERQVKIMDSDPELGGVAGGATFWKGDTEVTSLPGIKIADEDLLLMVLLRKVGLATSTFLCKKYAFEAMGGFDTGLIRSQDLQLFSDFIARYRVRAALDVRTTKMYIESAINRLNSEKLAKNKEDFFNSISSVLKKFNASTQRRIKSANYYEVAFCALKERNYQFVLKYFLMGFRSIPSIADLYSRTKRRYKNKVICKK
jgi:Glycosyltransferases, probably involved in cell wall biogenesis